MCVLEAKEKLELETTRYKNGQLLSDDDGKQENSFQTEMYRVYARKKKKNLRWIEQGWHVEIDEV